MFYEFYTGDKKLRINKCFFTGFGSGWFFRGSSSSGRDKRHGLRRQSTCHYYFDLHTGNLSMVGRLNNDDTLDHGRWRYCQWLFAINFWVCSRHLSIFCKLYGWRVHKRQGARDNNGCGKTHSCWRRHSRRGR